jgi:tetratricopeptide (TPR) repeat protein
MRHVLLCAALLATSALPATAQISAKTTADEQRADLYFTEGMKDLAAESYDTAVKEFSEAVTLNPKHKLAYYGLGRAHMGLKRFPEAIRAYEASRDLYTAQTGSNFANTMEADLIRQQDQAQLQSAIAQLSANKSATATANSSTIRAMRNQLTQIQSRRDQQKNPSLDNGVPAFLSLALGSAYFRSERLHDAEVAYKDAIAMEPKAGEAWSNLAVVSLATNRADEADRAVTNAEKAGYHVHPGLKDDIKKKRAGG